MTTMELHQNIKPKTFTYHTRVTEVKGRAGSLRSEGKPDLSVSSPPEFKGQKGVWTPEDFFVAAIEVCLMLTFVGLAEKRGLQFTDYESKAEGLLEWGETSFRFTQVVVSPFITLAEGESPALAGEVLKKAHETCLVANSVSCTVMVEPHIEVASPVLV